MNKIPVRSVFLILNTSTCLSFWLFSFFFLLIFHFLFVSYYQQHFLASFVLLAELNRWAISIWRLSLSVSSIVLHICSECMYYKSNEMQQMKLWNKANQNKTKQNQMKWNEKKEKQYNLKSDPSRWFNDEIIEEK